MENLSETKNPSETENTGCVFEVMCNMVDSVERAKMVSARILDLTGRAALYCAVIVAVGMGMRFFGIILLL